MSSIDVFQYVYPNDNDMFSKFSGDEIQNLIVLLDDYYLKLRNTLDIKRSITFGLEIEYEYANNEEISKELGDLLYVDRWVLKKDGSLEKGGEISSPVLNDNETTWKELKRVCKVIIEHARIGDKSSSHVHIGSHILEKKENYYVNFMRLWSAYENIIFRFCYGEYLNNRPNIVKYAKPVSKLLKDNCDKFDKNEISFLHLLFNLSNTRYQAVNFENLKYTYSRNYGSYNTLEFRCPNGSLEPTIWQNNVNLFVKLLEYSKNNNYDKDLINHRYDMEEGYMDLDWYNKIYLEEALELCDLIFDNNLDKVYFLKQYLKSFEDIKYISEYKKCKKLVK